jgi:hypothetical protein
MVPAGKVTDAVLVKLLDDNKRLINLYNKDNGRVRDAGKKVAAERAITEQTRVVKRGKPAAVAAAAPAKQVAFSKSSKAQRARVEEPDSEPEDDFAFCGDEDDDDSFEASFPRTIMDFGLAPPAGSSSSSSSKKHPAKPKKLHSPDEFMTIMKKALKVVMEAQQKHQKAYFMVAPSKSDLARTVKKEAKKEAKRKHRDDAERVQKKHGKKAKKTSYEEQRKRARAALH